MRCPPEVWARTSSSLISYPEQGDGRVGRRCRPEQVAFLQEQLSKPAATAPLIPTGRRPRLRPRIHLNVMEVAPAVPRGRKPGPRRPIQRNDNASSSLSRSAERNGRLLCCEMAIDCSTIDAASQVKASSRSTSGTRTKRVREGGMSRWTIDDIPWDQFDPSKIEGEVVPMVKTAALVEHNSADYATYLCNVFHDDREFQNAAISWAAEEKRHGESLGRWAEAADPSFDFTASVKRFVDGYRIPVDASSSVRGSRSGELIARCVVECGTSLFYSALRVATQEPVL